MKVAPLVFAIDNHNKEIHQRNLRIDYLLVHTGQHYDIDMSEVLFQDLGLPKPDIDFEVASGVTPCSTGHSLDAVNDFLCSLGGHIFRQNFGVLGIAIFLCIKGKKIELQVNR